MSYRIAAVSIRDYMRIHEVRISPDADSTLLLIGGENAQGKTSVVEQQPAPQGRLFE